MGRKMVVEEVNKKYDKGGKGRTGRKGTENARLKKIFS
jgi:hypothetical protein